MGRLTTHILDTASGRPAGGMKIDLLRVEGEPRLVKSVVTNADGRVDEPLLEGEALSAGLYELRFAVGDYHRAAGNETGFYDEVPVRFRVSGADEHYHVPLLIAPHGYSTYRGS